MANSSFLLKETNYTKNGKTSKSGKIRNSYNQLLKSIKHSLRLENEEDNNIHIIKDKTKNNIIYTPEKNFLNNEEILKFIENEILKNIKNYENINDKEERLKILKQYQDAKLAISKKTNLKELDELLKEDLNATEILKNLNLKNDKRTVKTLENYIFLKNERNKLKEETHTYKNQTLVKEIIFKIPEGQALNVKKEDFVTIQNNFLSKYFSEYELFFSAIHADEGTEDKAHLHMFLSGFNTIKNDFDINDKIFNTINEKYNLGLDINNFENHKITMRKFHEDFYEFFNYQLKALNYKDRIALKTYESEEEIRKRLKIKQEDDLTITQKHTKLINQKIAETLEKMEGEKPKILKNEISENTSFLSSKKTYKLEIEAETKEDVKKIIDSINKFPRISNFIQNLEKEKQDTNNKLYILKDKYNEEKTLFLQRENKLEQQIKELKNYNEEYKKETNESLTKLNRLNTILKNIIYKITKINLFKFDDFSENEILEAHEKNEKTKKEELNRIKQERENIKKEDNTKNDFEKSKNRR